MKNEKELVRYRIWFDNNYNEIVDEDPDGEYVRHEQAAAIVEEARLQQKAWADKWDYAISRAEAAESELVQIKKENIEKLADLISKEMIKSAEEISDTWANNLIYGNNEDDDSNSGLSSDLSGGEPS